MATLVDAVAEVFTFEALSGTTSSFTQGSSDRYIFGGAGWVGFGPLPDVNALKYGGSGGTDITPGSADVSFFFGNAALTSGSAIPGPSGTSTIYGAATAGLQGMAVGAAWEDVDSADDYTTNSGAQGDTNEAVCSFTVPNCVENQWVQGWFIAVSGNVTITTFLDDVDTTEIVEEDLDPGVTFAAVCYVRKQATANGNCVLQVRARSTSAAGTDAIAWAGAGERLIDAESGGGPTYTLTADGGTYSYSGTAADLRFNRVVAADPATFSYSGTNASLLFNRRISADTGSYTLTGQDAGLRFNRRLDAQGATYALTGQDATLSHSGVATYTLAAEGGTFALTGTDVTFRMGRVLAAENGGFSYAGADATLRYSGEAAQTTGAPGPRRPWIAYINGKRVIGDLSEIRSMVEALAQEAAEKDVAQAKPTKKPRIVVQPGKLVDIPKPENIQSISDTQGLEIQANIRNIYHIAYAKAKLIAEQDEEDTLMVLL